MPGGPSAISRPNVTSTSGLTASTCRPASKTDAQCLLVIIGATPEGKKELVGLIDGVRESVQSWRELLLDLRRRGLSIGPELAVADGALGFWQALEEVWPKTRGQRCWVHKTVNVLNKLPKSLQAKAKRALQDIWMAETKKEGTGNREIAGKALAGRIEDKVVERGRTLRAFLDGRDEAVEALRSKFVLEERHLGLDVTRDLLLKGRARAPEHDGAQNEHRSTEQKRVEGGKPKTCGLKKPRKGHAGGTPNPAPFRSVLGRSSCRSWRAAG